MKLLLDTHMLLWAAAGTLPGKAESLVVNANNTLYFVSAQASASSTDLPDLR